MRKFKTDSNDFHLRSYFWNQQNT